MKKILCFFVVVLAIAVGYQLWFHSTKTPNAQDLATIEAVVPGASFVRVGDMGDFLLRTPVTPELKAIASKAHTAEFLSVKVAEVDVSDEYVLINVTPRAILQNAGINEKCMYRVFYGTVKDFERGNYAVKLCEE